MAQFTVETAAEMGRRSAELAKQRKEQRALVLAEKPMATELVADYSKQKAERTRKQLELVDQMIDQCDDADVLDALTRSKERLFRIWAHCAGIPGPGNLKPSSPSRQQRRAIPEPVAIPPVVGDASQDAQH